MKGLLKKSEHAVARQAKLKSLRQLQETIQWSLELRSWMQNYLGIPRKQIDINGGS